MKIVNKIPGTLVAIIFCLITIVSVIFPAIQLSAIFSSTAIDNLIKKFLVDQNSISKCKDELKWLCVIYFTISLILSVIFYLIQYKKKLGWSFLIILLLIQFYMLQVPFFIFEVGTYYNCKVDGQTIMGFIFSSPKVSLTLILFGIIYDIIAYKKLIDASK